MVAAPLLDSSSGWACTHIRRSCSCSSTTAVPPDPVPRDDSPRTNNRRARRSPVTLPHSGPRRPPGRYDDARKASRPLVVLAAVVTGVVVAGGVYALYTRHNAGRLAYEVRGYDVRSDASVRITWEVSLATGEVGECKVRARGVDLTDVGTAVVPVGPGRGGALVTSYDLATTARAKTGEVVGCRHLDTP